MGTLERTRQALPVHWERVRFVKGPCLRLTEVLTEPFSCQFYFLNQADVQAKNRWTQTSDSVSQVGLTQSSSRDPSPLKIKGYLGYKT